MKTQSYHWADINADKIIRERPDQTRYVCASGITPSGTIHIGNFREIISVALVAQALSEKGHDVRFIYSWDDYDVFRKVPKNMPEQDKLKTYLRMPITDVPDTRGIAENYARANELELEKLLPKVGINPEYIYQAAEYRIGRYAQGIRTALEKREIIREILNEHRTTPLEENWYPVNVFCGVCRKDTTTVIGWDGEWDLTYRCGSCDSEKTIDLRTNGDAKLQWRVDWPMRWKEESVDFEPAGKDHHSEGGSFDTARKIVARVYNGDPPVTFQYDFISIKGRGGKISSSSGEVVSLADVLEIYQPEIIRYLFAGTRPNSEFAISFDLDVLKIYEDYDKCERIYYGRENVGEKRRAKEKRIYELSQIDAVPTEMPYQITFRHLCNLMQINEGDAEQTLAAYDLSDSQRWRLLIRCRCAWNWVTTYAPENFRFQLRRTGTPPVTLEGPGREAIRHLALEVEKVDDHSEKSFAEALYRIAEKAGLPPKDFFKTVYTVLINKEQGPRLAGFIMTVGKERVLGILRDYR